MGARSCRTVSLDSAAKTTGDGTIAHTGRIKAYYLSRNIDFMRFSQNTFNGETHALQRDGVIVSMRPLTDNEVVGRYMVIFGYGSVVFFNVEDERMQKEFLEQVKPFCSSLLMPQRTEDYGIRIVPGLDDWAEVAHDHVVVQQLDLKNVRVISGILGVSVAMDYYDVMVEHMLEGFRCMNAEIERDGKCTISKKELFKWIATNNAIQTDAVSRLRLLERSETAWRYAQYSGIWEALHGEFDLDKRFSNMQYKLELVQENTKFFLEVQQHQNSGRLEWIIIILIAMELLLGLYGHVEKHMEGDGPSPLEVIHNTFGGMFDGNENAEAEGTDPELSLPDAAGPTCRGQRNIGGEQI